MKNLQAMSCEEKIEFLRENPIFWSRLGLESEVPDREVHRQHAKRHRALFDRGIVVHSSVIPSGWIGVDQYDYTDVDDYLNMLFTECPEAIFLPRVKLNVPAGWCEAHPDDVFVYGCGPRTHEEIVAMIGTPAHGSHPFKKTDMIALQSFSSRRWVADGCEALRRFIEHVEASPWADRIIGYHIAYGTSGETSQWGSWNEDPYHKGDYGVNATKNFIAYAAERGKQYDAVPPIEQRFFIREGGAPHYFQFGTPTLEQMFFHTEQDEQSYLYAEFQRDSDVDALTAFGKVVKALVPEKLVGGFYGYISEPKGSANLQHTGFDRLLASPYIDFIASPKGYRRISPTDPGFGQAVPNSVNRKKLWVDELDNRTHLCTEITRPDYDFPAKNFEETRAVYWREFTKNIAHHQGYWWMDLRGGWLDSDEIQSEIALLNETSKELYRERDRHQSVAEVLLVVDENALLRMRPNHDLHDAAIHHTGSTIKESGVPIDYYRMTDLAELDLSQYKMIVFMNAYYADREALAQLIAKTAPDCHIVWNYTAGILDQKSGSFGLENVRKLTGFSIGEYPVDESIAFPLIYAEEGEGISAREKYPDGKIKTAVRKEGGRTYILNAMPADLTVESARALLQAAGVHLYTNGYCTVHADNRFLYVLSERDQIVKINLKAPATCRNVFTDEVYEQITELELKMKEGTCVFLKYL
ncbi:MAG: hypothetical protein IJC46_04330 [Clostridia bacterium]|nr:hypothetical protein [Clostridia bacterium]